MGFRSQHWPHVAQLGLQTLCPRLSGGRTATSLCFVLSPAPRRPRPSGGLHGRVILHCGLPWSSHLDFGSVHWPSCILSPSAIPSRMSSFSLGCFQSKNGPKAECSNLNFCGTQPKLQAKGLVWARHDSFCAHFTMRLMHYLNTGLEQFTPALGLPASPPQCGPLASSHGLLASSPSLASGPVNRLNCHWLLEPNCAPGIFPPRVAVECLPLASMPWPPGLPMASWPSHGLLAFPWPQTRLLCKA